MVSTLKQTDGYKDFTSRTREIYTDDVTHESDAIAPNANISRQPVVVYCSGTDERISDTLLNTRSDANILACLLYTSKAPKQPKASAVSSRRSVSS